MNFFDIKRLLEPIKRKIYLIIGRAILTAIDNSEGTQKIQVTGMKDEVGTGIERFQNYGFESYPKPGSAEAVIGYINGNRDQGIALVVHDRGYRPKDLIEGETMMYHLDGNTKVHIKEGVVEITGGGTLEFAALPSKVKTVIDTMIDIFNGHVHTGVQTGAGTSAVSSTTMTKSDQTAYSSTEVKIS